MSDDKARDRIRKEVETELAQRSADETRERLRAMGKVVTAQHEVWMAESAAELHKKPEFAREIDRLVEARMRRRRWWR